MANFEKAFPVLIKHEGKFSWDKNDPGGPTMYGCTQHDISVFLGRSASVQDVRNFSLDSAATLFRKNYWNIMHCDLITDDALATCVFDQGVLAGTVTVIRILQQCVDVKVDGQMGPQTAKAINAAPRDALAIDFLDSMEVHYNDLVAHKHKLADFKKGWTNRVNDLRKVVKASAPADSLAFVSLSKALKMRSAKRAKAVA